MFGDPIWCFTQIVGKRRLPDENQHLTHRRPTDDSRSEIRQQARSIEIHGNRQLMKWAVHRATPVLHALVAGNSLITKTFTMTALQGDLQQTGLST
jgi:hypothetical protein